MKKRIIKVITISASLIIAGCAYTFLNVRFGFSIPCVFNKLTGLECPGCGVTRMCISLLRFDLKTAFAYNPVLLCMMPVGAVLLFKGLRRYIKTGFNKITKNENTVMIIMIVILLVFGIIRNIA